MGHPLLTLRPKRQEHLHVVAICEILSTGVWSQVAKGSVAARVPELIPGKLLVMVGDKDLRGVDAEVGLYVFSLSIAPSS